FNIDIETQHTQALRRRSRTLLQRWRRRLGKIANRGLAAPMIVARVQRREGGVFVDETVWNAPGSFWAAKRAFGRAEQSIVTQPVHVRPVPWHAGCQLVGDDSSGRRTGQHS